MNDLAAVQSFWNEHVCGDVFTSLPDRTSPAYLDEVRRQRYHYEYHLPPFLRRVARAGPTILEIGCGVGTDLAELSRLGCQVTGIDLTPNAVHIAECNLQQQGLAGQVRLGNAEQLDFPAQAFDAVYSFGVLHHTPHIEIALSEVYRVLRPGGRAFLMLYSRYSLNHLAHAVLRWPYESPRDHTTDAPITRMFSRREVLQLLRRFDEVRVEKRYLFGAGWRPLADWLPWRLNDGLGRVAGWHWLIEARKP